MSIEHSLNVVEPLTPVSHSFGVAESVSPSHVDKLSDRLADMILDALIQIDPQARCGIEVVINASKCLVTGEVTLRNVSSFEAGNLAQSQAEQFLANEGWRNLSPEVNFRPQASELTDASQRGAGDQSICVGVATALTPEFISPELKAARQVTHLLWERASREGTIGRDGKVIVVRNGCRLRAWLRWHVSNASPDFRRWVDATLAGTRLDELYLNVGSSFAEAGLNVDTGALGRKLVCDSYGALYPIGGGAISGKDASKVDRTGNYGARWAACELVREHGGEAIVWLVYTLGESLPVHTHYELISGKKRISGVLSAKAMGLDRLRERFGLDNTPPGFFSDLSLRGHYGRGLTWD